MIDVTQPFSNLEPNHVLHERVSHDGRKVLVVACPIELPEWGTHGETAWDIEDGENWMVNCLLCEELVLIEAGKPQFDHGCYDSGDLALNEVM